MYSLDSNALSLRLTCHEHVDKANRKSIVLPKIMTMHATVSSGGVETEGGGGAGGWSSPQGSLKGRPLAHLPVMLP